MNSINPTTSSALLSMQATQDLAVKKPTSIENISQDADSQISSSTNVTLSSGTQSPATDYLALNPQQNVRSGDSVNDSPVNANQTSSGLNYASELQNRTNYLRNL